MNCSKCIDDDTSTHARTLAHAGDDVHVEVQGDSQTRENHVVSYLNIRFPVLGMLPAMK